MSVPFVDTSVRGAIPAQPGGGTLEPVDRPLAGVGAGWDNDGEGHDKQSTPAGAPTPHGGLADRGKDTTD